MRPHEVVNLSLSTLIFSYNLNFSTFTNLRAQSIHRSCEIIDGAIKSSDDFSILTNNTLLSAFQSHCILLYEAIVTNSKMVGRSNYKSPNDPLYPIRKFVDELRHAHAHIRTSRLQPVCDAKKSKQPHRFQIHLPIVKTPSGLCYDLKSPVTRKFSFKVTPGGSVRLNKSFIERIVLLSFHIREVLKYRKQLTCDKFLQQFISSWKQC